MEGTGLVLTAFSMLGLRLTLSGNQMWYLFEWAEGVSLSSVNGDAADTSRMPGGSTTKAKHA